MDNVGITITYMAFDGDNFEEEKEADVDEELTDNVEEEAVMSGGRNCRLCKGRSR